MPADPPVMLLIAVLAGAVALNLWLTLRLAARLREAEEAAAPLLLPAGTPLPPFEGRAPDGRSLASADVAGEALVLTFLSSGCPACREAVSELAAILPLADAAGVQLWVVASGIDAALAQSSVAARLLALEPDARRRFNPRGLAPAYLFVDHRSLVEAGGLIGDPDWRAFVSQLRSAEHANS